MEKQTEDVDSTVLATLTKLRDDIRCVAYDQYKAENSQMLMFVWVFLLMLGMIVGSCHLNSKMHINRDMIEEVVNEGTSRFSN